MNKNTKRLRRLIRKAGQNGNAELSTELPVTDYHSNPKMRPATFPTAIMGAKGIVSRNTKRNTAMVVSHNTDADGVKQSLTTHEKLHPSDSMQFKAHSYIKYRG